MKLIHQTPNKEHWPRKRVKTIECRKRDLIVRIADWTKLKEEPAYDVELYIGGVYDWNESKTFCVEKPMTPTTKSVAWANAIRFASSQMSKLL